MINASPRPRAATTDDLARLPDDITAEIIDGELVLDQARWTLFVSRSRAALSP